MKYSSVAAGALLLAALWAWPEPRNALLPDIIPLPKIECTTLEILDKQGALAYKELIQADVCLAGPYPTLSVVSSAPLTHDQWQQWVRPAADSLRAAFANRW